MPKKKTTKVTLSQEQKQALAILKKRGIYKPTKPRAAPNKYAKSLANQFIDLARGNAKVVTVKSAKRGNKGFKEAKEFSLGGAIKAIRNKVIVPVQKGETATYNKKSGKISIVRKIGKDRYIRQPFKHKIKSVDDLFKQLGPHSRIAVPLYRGKRGTEWTYLSRDEFLQFWFQYGPGAANVGKRGGAKTYKGLLDNIEEYFIKGPSAVYDDEDDAEV